jgi:hypothetical protein
MSGRTTKCLANDNLVNAREKGLKGGKGSFHMMTIDHQGFITKVTKIMKKELVGWPGKGKGKGADGKGKGRGKRKLHVGKGKGKAYYDQGMGKGSSSAKGKGSSSAKGKGSSSAKGNRYYDQLRSSHWYVAGKGWVAKKEEEEEEEEEEEPEVEEPEEDEPEEEGPEVGEEDEEEEPPPPPPKKLKVGKADGKAWKCGTCEENIFVEQYHVKNKNTRDIPHHWNCYHMKKMAGQMKWHCKDLGPHIVTQNFITKVTKIVKEAKLDEASTTTSTTEVEPKVKKPPQPPKRPPPPASLKKEWEWDREGWVGEEWEGEGWEGEAWGEEEWGVEEEEHEEHEDGNEEGWLQVEAAW